MDVTVPEGTSLVAFLESKNMPVGAVVIEFNKEVLPKGEYDGIKLNEGDTLEILQVIGGG